jgi:hypothetical protein
LNKVLLLLLMLLPSLQLIVFALRLDAAPCAVNDGRHAVGD